LLTNAVVIIDNVLIWHSNKYGAKQNISVANSEEAGYPHMQPAIVE
jgi:hypothetical protein